MKKLIISTVLLFLIGLFGSNFVNGQVVNPIPSYQTLDLSTTSNSGDFLFGIDCSDSNYIYTTVHQQGALARISKADSSVTFFNNNAVATGEDWYSVVRDSTTGKLFMNEKDTGITRVFDPSSSTFSSISIPQNIASGSVSYTTSYSDAPHKITVTGVGSRDFGFGSYGELKATNGYVWQVINYNYDFTTAEEATGATDVSFGGVARIDPSTNAVTRYAISGSSALRGITIDASDSTILWITDILADKIYKFNTNTGSVVDTINLSAGSKARGIADDGTYLYVAKNEASGSGNSKILKIVKSDHTITTIDTGALIGSGKTGTFSVFIAGNYLIWTDESSHIGTVLLTNNNVKTVSNTNGNVDTNHFGCVVGSNVYIAGHGSAVVSSFSIAGSSESSHGDSCAGDCYSPHFGTDENGKEFYKDGLTIIAQNFTRVINIPNVLHVLGNETINMPVGQPINFTLKAMDSNPDQIKSCEIAFGLERGHFVKQDAEFILGVKRTFDGIVSTYEEGHKTAYRDFVAIMENQDKYVFCKFLFTPTHYLSKDMFAIQAIDIHQYDGMNFVNEGIFFRGMSEIGTPIFDYMDKRGTIHTLTILDQTLENMSIALDENNNYWYGEFGKLWNKEFVRPDMTGSLSKYHGYDRNDYFEFKAYKLGQELIAITHPNYGFDSRLIQNQVKPSFAHDIENPHPRGWDSVPNMMKALGEYEKSKPDTIVR